jgi:predicted aldo/keto reductase-like oxidoreductase
MPCPNGVNIPGCFEQYNNAGMYEAMENARFFYNYSVFLGANGRASRCVECGECLDKCPQQIPIPDVLKDVEALLG